MAAGEGRACIPLPWTSEGRQRSEIVGGRESHRMSDELIGPYGAENGIDQSVELAREIFVAHGTSGCSPSTAQVARAAGTSRAQRKA